MGKASKDPGNLGLDIHRRDFIKGFLSQPQRSRELRESCENYWVEEQVRPAFIFYYFLLTAINFGFEVNVSKFYKKSHQFFPQTNINAI